MKDTIGAHMAEAMRWAEMAGRQQIVHREHDRAGKQDPDLERRLAHSQGAAVGHTFRAAELAYDLGAQEQRQRDWLVHLIEENRNAI